MAAPTIGRRPAWVPATAKVEWSHPLAAGLKMYVMLGVSLRDLANGTALTVSAGSVSPVASPYGAAGLSALARLAFPNLTRFEVSTTASGFTIFALTRGIVTGSQTVFCSRASTPIIHLYNDGVTGSQFQTRTTDNNLNGLNASAPLDTSFVRCTGTWAAGVKLLYTDRSVPTTATNGGSPTITGQSSAALYGDAFGASTTSQTIVATAFWNRALSANEVAMLHRDPFCMLRG